MARYVMAQNIGYSFISLFYLVDRIVLQFADDRVHY